MYTKDSIAEVPTGWSIDILDPDGDSIATLDFVMTKGQLYSDYVERCLHDRADALLSHLNRGL